ncbi:MAG: hypothetical protein M3005_01410 [Apilactobacillus sp.]|uniref:hypothetical protein n=1 Tax=Apilactobacillus TaxID=2767877 RepID=UPI0025E7B366|nr:hypothetical protein [Apilactobacillus sp.]MCT6822511.1 hypothetical protein [Apilactobacillus sp.]MCT6858151.1 hypothetical protein [Apilactobacillus sp.]
MKPIVKELLLNIAIYIFPFIFILSGLSGNLVMMKVGFFLTAFIAALMTIIYVLYIFTHRKKERALYRQILLLIHLVMLIGSILFLI